MKEAEVIQQIHTAKCQGNYEYALELSEQRAKLLSRENIQLKAALAAIEENQDSLGAKMDIVTIARAAMAAAGGDALMLNS